MATRDRSSRHRAPATRPTRATSGSAPLPAWAVLCFFASGAAGLLYEVVWSKQLSYLLGNSLQAVATVVAAFLCGLALGACLLGPRLGKRGDSVRAYAVLELGVALLGLISLPVLRGLDPLVGVLYRSLGGEGTAFALARGTLLFALLVPPAALMGATLPVMVGCFERDRVGPKLARLYALNTLGAVAGTVAGGFWLLPAVGLMATTWIAAALNLAAGAAAWFAPRRLASSGAAGAPAERSTPLAKSVPAVGLEGSARFLFGLLFLASGFAALSYQITWVRIFTLVFGSSVYSFSAVLAVYLLGLALGGFAVARLVRRAEALVGFAALQLVIAALAAFQLIGFSRLPQWMYELAERAGTSWSHLILGEIGILAAFVLPPCILLGATFPLAARMLQRGDAGGAAGFAYAVNTAGTIAGSLVVGLVAIPTWGVQPTHVFTLCLSAAIGIGTMALAASRRETRGRDLFGAAAAVAAVCAVTLLAPRWQPALMANGIFRPVQAQKIVKAAESSAGAGSIVERAARSERVLYYAEGINGSVMVGANEKGHERWLRVGGKVDASTGRDMETQVLLGLIPAACADSGARTMVIGLGSGVTVAAALAAGAGPTEVVELEPKVIGASRFFHAAGEHPLDDPRVRLVLGDARTHLAYGGGSYGLIVSEPSNPWFAGVNNLFTVDFYRLVRARLTASGVFCQWIQLYELEPRTLASMVASFLDVFPDGQVYTMSRNSDMMLVASPPGCRLALERLRSPAALRMLRRGRIESPEALSGNYAGPLSALRGMAAGAPLDRDDLPIVEYRAPQDLVTVGRSTTMGHPLAAAVLGFTEAWPEGRLFSAWTRETWFRSRVHMLVEQDDVEHAAATVRAAGEAGLSVLAVGLDQEVAAGRRRLQALGEAERARALLAGGRETEGVRMLQHAADLDPANHRIRLWIADRRRQAGDFAGAEADLDRGRAGASPEVQADAALISGMLEIDRSQPLVAAVRFREVQQWSPERPDGYLYEAAARAAAGDSAGARGVLRRGLRQLPGDADLSTLLATIDGTR